MGGEVISIKLAAREADQFNADVCDGQDTSINLFVKEANHSIHQYGRCWALPFINL
jgi:hypothetical protein